VAERIVPKHYKISYSLQLSARLEIQKQLNSLLNFLSSNVTFHLTATNLYCQEYPILNVPSTVKAVHLYHQEYPVAKNYLHDSAITHDACCPTVQSPVLYR
jgi:hypothetical protein